MATLGIGELAEQTKVSVRTLRFYCDTGVIEPTRSAGGHRRFDQETVDQVKLVRRLRGLGLGLPVIVEVLGGRRSVAEAVAAARAELDVELADMAWRRASLVAVEQASPEDRAARLDLLAAVESGRAAFDALVAFWRPALGYDMALDAFVAMSVPDPPVDPTPAQVVAYAEMVGIASDRSLARSRRPWPVVDVESLFAGFDEAITQAAPLVAEGRVAVPEPVLDHFVAAHAAGIGMADSGTFRRDLLRTLGVDRDQRLRRYWRLYGELTGERAPLGTTYAWLLDGLAESVARQR
ncbi:MerR family transcriptional regulator [Kibdelosporangium lantanae]